MTDNERDRRSVADWVRPDHKTLLGLLGVHLVFLLVFWYLLVARPFGTQPARGVTAAVTSPVSIVVAPPHPMPDNQATLGTLSTTLRSSTRATAVSDWHHSPPGSSH